MRKIINIISLIIMSIVYIYLLFICKLGSAHLKELKYVYILAIPCLMVFLSSLLTNKKKNKSQNLYFYLVSYLVVLSGFAFSNARTSSSWITNHIYHYNYNLIPFKSIIELLNTPLSPMFAIYNILGNFLMLTPLAIILPLINKKFQNTKYFLLTISGLTLLIELLQFISNVGSFDIDDIILNILGAFIAYLIFKKLKFLKTIFLKTTITNKFLRILINIFYVLLVTLVIELTIHFVPIFKHDYEERNPQIDISNLKCLNEEKTYITDYNNYRYYSKCDYGDSLIKVGDIHYNLEKFIKSEFYNIEMEEKLKISKDEIITNVIVKVNKQNKKKLISQYQNGSSYFYNIDSIIIEMDNKLYDYLESLKQGIYLPLEDLSEISFVSKDNKYTIYKNKYFQELICNTGDIYDINNMQTNNYYLPLDYQIKANTCKYLNELD